MSFLDWVSETRARVADRGPRRGGLASLNELWVGALRRVGRAYDFGTPVYERDWDALVVLDACRVDLLREVAREYEREGRLPGVDVDVDVDVDADAVGARAGDDADAGGDGPGAGDRTGGLSFLDSGFETFESAGSQSAEWMDRNFGPEFEGEVARTAYVSGNPFSRDLDGDRFALLDEVWRYAWDEEFGGMPPRPVTDRAVSVGRSGAGAEFDRLVVHYMQPHVPFRSMADSAVDWGDPGDSFGRRRGVTAGQRSVWERLRDGDADRGAVWAAYRDNLEWVLGEVGLLLANLDADRVVVTADHANAMGEWWCYGHPDHSPVPALRQVPWLETTATDRGTYDPELEPPADRGEGEDVDVGERLAALGYT